MILGISGKKQSGKTTSGNFIASIFIANLGIAQKVHINSEGQIVVSDLFGNESYAGVLDITKPTNDFLIEQAINTLSPHLQLYSFADPLKKDICIDILGLTWDQCYGSDQDKNSLTSLEWNQMPGYTGNLKGFMTAREVMEYVGTGIFRKIKINSWVDGTINKILKEKPRLAIITDCRFPNEVEAIHSHQGKVIRLSRSKYSSESESESILDEKTYDWSKFDFIIYNDTMTIYDQCIELQTILQKLTVSK
jgi:hypothetical protein